MATSLKMYPKIVLEDSRGNTYYCESTKDTFDIMPDSRPITLIDENRKVRKFMKGSLTYVRDYKPAVRVKRQRRPRQPRPMTREQADAMRTGMMEAIKRLSQ